MRQAELVDAPPRPPRPTPRRRVPGGGGGAGSRSSTVTPVAVTDEHHAGGQAGEARPENKDVCMTIFAMSHLHRPNAAGSATPPCSVSRSIGAQPLPIAPPASSRSPSPRAPRSPASTALARCRRYVLNANPRTSAAASWVGAGRRYVRLSTALQRRPSARRRAGRPPRPRGPQRGGVRAQRRADQRVAGEAVGLVQLGERRADRRAEASRDSGGGRSADSGGGPVPPGTPDRSSCPTRHGAGSAASRVLYAMFGRPSTASTSTSGRNPR